MQLEETRMLLGFVCEFQLEKMWKRDMSFTSFSTNQFLVVATHQTMRRDWMP